MSAKHHEAEQDRIPSYEESIASTTHLAPQHTPSSQKTPTSFQQRIKDQRQRRVASILLDHIEPAIARNLEDATNDMTLILLGSDAFDPSTHITTSSMTSPSSSKPTSLIRLQGSDFNSNFLTSWSVVQELSDTLIRSMIDPATSPQLQSELPQISSNEPSAGTLPARPTPKSWFKRTFSMPGPDHDPTGQTGKWKLGWRSEENPTLTSRTVETSEVCVTAKLVAVTFRTESALGLLESRSVRCLWIDLWFRA